jgi:superfamily I DNA/RNA helicase
MRFYCPRHSAGKAILVDEGQDFHLAWWNLLRRVLRDDGKMLLVADATQDLYSRSCYWTDESMRGAGFDGPWFHLDGSYRFPRKLVPFLRQFADQFLPHRADINLPAEVQGEIFEQSVALRWLQVQEAGAVDVCVQAVCDLTALPNNVAWADITLLVATHEEGLRCVQALKLRGVKANHVEEHNAAEIRNTQ